jgi:hypothetical protein
VQERTKVLVLVTAPDDSLPEVALAPDQPLEAVQDVALVEDQVSVDDPPLETDVGFAVRDTVGAGGDTVTVADALCAPLAPVQVRLKVLLLVSAPDDSLPEVALVPDQPPEAVQDVASVEDHVSVDDAPLVTLFGFAASDTVGTAGGGGEPTTVTVVDALAVPPDPVQERLNVVVLVKAEVDEPPETPLVPDHPPEAVQDVAPVEDHESVEVPPLVTDVGFAANCTVGKGVIASLDWFAPGASGAAGQAANTSASAGASRRFLACNVSVLISCTYSPATRSNRDPYDRNALHTYAIPWLSGVGDKDAPIVMVLLPHLRTLL